MHADRNIGIHLDQRFHHLREHDVACIGARLAAHLDDDRRIDLGGSGLGDRQTLLHIVDVERRYAVVMLGSMIEQLTQCDASHNPSPSILFLEARLRLRNDCIDRNAEDPGEIPLQARWRRKISCR